MDPTDPLPEIPRDLQPGPCPAVRIVPITNPDHYDLWLDRDGDLAVDAARMGNEARFVNDYRGVPGRNGKKANAEFKPVIDS
ncbi:hypothetical protein N0V88_005465 [Collariella sp. IMI 366227]|nr:hypothetical protein N0V88_005465 [Collariella sp. IMI 366227]